MMDEGGCDLTILSSGGNDGPRCREYNEFMAKMVSDHPGRFGMFGSLPWPDVDASLKELTYCMDTLKADGVRLSTSYGDKWLGDPSFAPLFEECNRRKVVIYTHPSAPNCCAKLVPGIGDATIEFGTDTTRAIVRMIFSGSSAKYPDMKMIFSHAGGTMPYLIVRLIKDSGAVPKGFPYEASRFYYDTAQVAGPGAMFALKNVVPMSQIVFGTDYPYISVAQTAKNLKESKVFSDAELAQIDAGNALKLFPKYAS
jgi:predicted TIM-barrel fold metal-dependent hydrolase